MTHHYLPFQSYPHPFCFLQRPTRSQLFLDVYHPGWCKLCFQQTALSSASSTVSLPSIPHKIQLGLLHTFNVQDCQLDINNYLDHKKMSERNNNTDIWHYLPNICKCVWSWPMIFKVDAFRLSIRLITNTRVRKLW